MPEIKHYPSCRYHPTLPCFVVKTEADDAALKASDKAWREIPYPPEVSGTPTVTVEDLTAANAKLAEDLAAMTAERDSLAGQLTVVTSQRDELAAQLPKLQADLQKVTAALAKKKPADKPADKPEADPKAEPKPE